MTFESDEELFYAPMRTLALVLAGGRGARLKHLTDWQSKPAVSFGGSFKLIDFPLSNCINSGIRKIGILTQYKSDSLMQHIQNVYGYINNNLDEYVQLIPAQQRIGQSWYSGTSNAIYQNFDLIKERHPEYVLILAGDHVYKMDYRKLLVAHITNKSDLTIATIEMPVEDSKRLSVVTVDDDLRVTSFIAKPSSPHTILGDDSKALTSMGVYIFNADFLYDQLKSDSDNYNSTVDLTIDVIPNILKDSSYNVYAYRFIKHDRTPHIMNYWRDVGTIDSYWNANMDLLSNNPAIDLSDDRWPIHFGKQGHPQTKFISKDNDYQGKVINSIVSSGCIISDSSLVNTILSDDVNISPYSEINNSVILHNVRIGRNCRINHAIIDNGCYIPEGTIIGEDRSNDEKRFYVSKEGIVLVAPNMLGQQRPFF